MLRDEAVDGALEVDYGPEHALLMTPARELREHAFHGIEPGAGGCVKWNVQRRCLLAAVPSLTGVAITDSRPIAVKATDSWPGEPGNPKSVLRPIRRPYQRLADSSRAR